MSLPHNILGNTDRTFIYSEGGFHWRKEGAAKGNMLSHSEYEGLFLEDERTGRMSSPLAKVTATSLESTQEKPEKPDMDVINIIQDEVH